jgi:hypothetical protein
MTRCSKLLVVAVAFALITPVLAQAQATRTWVSGVGDDANPCSRTAPCKTWAGAISKTAPGGEISALDPGGFGGVTITKSITLNGDGTLASIVNALTNGVIINAATTDVIVIRNVSINGVGSGLNGIRYLAAKHVIVENCNISGFLGTGAAGSGNGIEATLTTNGALTVVDTNIVGIATGSNGTTGIRASTTGGTLNVSVDNVNIRNTHKGVAAFNIGTKVVVTDSTIMGMVNNGGANGTAISAESNGTINAVNNTISGNPLAVNAVGGGLARISGNRVFENGLGFACSGGGAIQTGQDNTVAATGAGGCVLGTTQITVQ